MYGVGEILASVNETAPQVVRPRYTFRALLPRVSDVFKTWKDLGIGSLIGFVVGVEYGRAEPLLAVVPNEWVQSNEDNGTIVLDAVLSRPLVMFYPNTVVHQIISKAAEEKGVSFTVEYSCIQGETLIAFANAGIGVAVLTASIANLSYVKNCKILEIIEPKLHRHFTMITRKGITLPPAAKHLYSLIAQDITDRPD